MQSEEIVFNNSDDFFRTLLQAIGGSKRFIHLESYIFDQDTLGNKILHALADAAKRGVVVQLLIDGVGSPGWRFVDAEHWRAQGIQLKFFHALPWQKHPYKVWQSLSLKKIALGFSKLNRRNHRKICIIDYETVFLGSMNVSDRHLVSQSGALAWRDTGVLIRGGNVDRYVRSCREAWYFSQRHYGFRWNRISKQKRRDHREMLLKMRSAEKRIWITNPYFVPDFFFIRTICRAARKGVDVKVLVPKRPDVFGIKFAMEGYYTLFLTFGIQIYEYEPSMLHAKVLVVDDWVMMGSTNLDHRSVFYNLEVDAILTKQESILVIQNQFLKDLQASRKIEFNSWKERSWFNRLWERFFLFFRGVF